MLFGKLTKKTSLITHIAKSVNINLCLIKISNPRCSVSDGDRNTAPSTNVCLKLPFSFAKNCYLVLTVRRQLRLRDGIINIFLF